MLLERFTDNMRALAIAAGDGALYVVGLSGGMDSTVLAHLLKLHAENSGWPAGAFVLAHLNHRLRGGEADADAEFCRDLAEKLGIRFFARREDVAEIARELGLGVEEAGRLVRYRFFRDIGLEIGGGGKTVALTAHHADDQVETILMNLRRGAHRRGLRGMRPYSTLPLPPGPPLAVGRPFLTITKAEIRDYAAANGLEWREDASNTDLGYRRNRIRRQIIPMLEGIMPGFTGRLLEKANILAAEEEALAAAGEELARRHSRRENGGRLFTAVPAEIDNHEHLLYAFRYILEEELGGRLPYGAVLSRLAELAESGRFGEQLSLPGGLLARKERDGLFFLPAGEAAANRIEAEEVILPDPPFDIRAGGMSILCECLPEPRAVPDADKNDPMVEWLNMAALRWPLRIRPPRPGERFRPLGAPGSRKIQDILVDLKTPLRKRAEVRILADHAGGVWLWPHRLAHRARLTGEENGRALRVRMAPL